MNTHSPTLLWILPVKVPDVTSREAKRWTLTHQQRDSDRGKEWSTHHQEAIDVQASCRDV